MSECYLCGSTEECRPYGENAQMICHPCMTSSPEREAEAHRQFEAQMNGCGSVAIIGTEAGPTPPKEKFNG